MSNKTEELSQYIGKRVVIVADDFKGYGKKTKYVGQKGTITTFRPSRNGFLPVIKLDSGEVISRNNVWWDLLPVSGL